MKSKSGAEAEAEQVWWRAIRVHSKASALLQFFLSPLPACLAQEQPQGPCVQEMDVLQQSSRQEGPCHSRQQGSKQARNGKLHPSF